MDSGSHSLSVELGFWIAIVSGIPDSPSCIPDPKPGIPDSTNIIFPDSGYGFRKQMFPGFRKPDSLTWYDTGQLLFQVPTTVSEYGSTVVQLVKSSENGRSRASASKKPEGMVDL